MTKIVCTFPNSMPARVWLGDLSKCLHSCQKPRRDCFSCLFLSNIFGAAVAGVISQRFAADPTILSALVVLADAPKKEDDRPEFQTLLATVLCAAWIMLHGNDAGIVLRFPCRLGKMMTVVRWSVRSWDEYHREQQYRSRLSMGCTAPH